MGMSRYQVDNMIQEALKEFATALGLDYSACREELDGGKIKFEFLPSDISEELIEIAKETYPGRELIPYYHSMSRMGVHEIKGESVRVPTILGKVEAIASHLGVEFEVTPEKVVAEKVKAKVVKKGKK